MKSVSNFLRLGFIISFFSIVSGCTTGSVKNNSPVLPSDLVYSKDTILLSFAGDIMAHKPNWNIKDFSEPYKDITDIISKCDAAFVNFETPVTDSKDYSSYPFFNVHHQYAEAAINAGFNVFCLSNNHTNDQNLEGLRATKKYFDSLRSANNTRERKIYSSGIKDSPSSPFTYEMIEIKGWKILYIAVTEILNQPSYSSYINYIPPTTAARKNFLEKMKILREENPCDMFIMSLHTSEEEYVLTTTASQRKFYEQILDSGIDILNANHPHVPKEWHLIHKKNGTDKMIFFSQGNTISAQRTQPDYQNPSNIRDYTGDGFITQVRFEKADNGVKIINIDPVLITNYITPQWHFVIRKLNDAFIDELTAGGKKSLASYYQKRIKLMESIKGKTIWE